MNVSKFFASILIVFALPITGYSQQLQLTVERAIELGLTNSKTLHSSLMRVNYADAKAGEVNASRLPSLKLGGSYTRLSDVPPFELSLPPQLGLGTGKFTLSPTIVNNYNIKVSVQQPLFTGFRLNAVSDAADFNAQATAQEYSKDKADLVYNIRVAYWSLFKAIEFKKVIDENVSQVQAHLKDVQSMMDQGMATTNDLLKVQVQLSDAQLHQIDANNAVQLANIGLNNVVGISLATKIELESEVHHHVPAEFAELDALVHTALESRPELKAMDYRVKASEAGVTAAKSGWFPQIYLAGNYYYNRPNQRIVPNVDRFDDTWDVSVGVSLDIWNWGTTLHQTDQAQAQLAEAKDVLGQLQDGITLEITQTYLNLNQAKERIAVAEQGVKAAEENHRTTNQRFKEGLALNTDLLDAEVSLLQARTNYTQVLVDYELAEARLQKAIGGEKAE